MMQTRAVKSMDKNIQPDKDDANINSETALSVYYTRSFYSHVLYNIGRILRPQWNYIPRRDIIISCIFRHF